MAAALIIKSLRSAIVGPISLTVAAGDCAAVTGPSGSGKSVFLRMIADLDPNEGEVELGGFRREAMAAPAWRRQAIYLAAEAGWWAERVDAHFASADLKAAKAMAARLAIPEALFKREVRLLSTGERQRLALVRSIIRKPACLLLDEPTSALDRPSVERVEALFDEERARGTVLILVSHDADQAQRVGTQHYTLASGRLSAAS